MFAKSIRQILPGRPMVEVAPDDTLETVLERMLDTRATDVAVIDADGAPMGALNVMSLVRHVSQHAGLGGTLVHEVMVQAHRCIETRDSPLDALRVLRQSRAEYLPVRDLTGKCIGLIAPRDIPAEYHEMLRRETGAAAA